MSCCSDRSLNGSPGCPGYSDIEGALLAEAGLIGPDTTIATTVHPLQVIDDDLPATGHDFTVDLIVTPNEVITCPAGRRGTGIAPVGRCPVHG